jgi:hypothetical protein
VTTRRVVVVGVLVVAAIVCGALLYSRLRIPPQRDGDGWRVIAQVPTPDDDAIQARRLTALPSSVGSDQQLRTNEAALLVLVGGGECEHFRIRDIDRADDTIHVSAGRYRGIRDRLTGCEDVGKIAAYVVGVSPELANGAQFVAIDDLDPTPIAG